MSGEVTQDHALYRFWSPDGALLYVGITNDPGRRWREHATDKPWWHEVATITVERHPSRAAVELAERLAIITERPACNMVHNWAERWRIARATQALQSAHFESVIVPRSVRVSWQRAHDRATMAAIFVFVAVGMLTFLLAGLPNLQGMPAPSGPLPCAGAIGVFVMIVIYLALRVRLARFRGVISAVTR